MTGEALAGRTTAGIVRIGDTVRRPIRGDVAFGHAVLRHLERSGVDLAPRFLGIDDDGRVIVSFIPGDVPTDLAILDDDIVHAGAALLRLFHDATATMPEVVAAGGEVACHNDFAPTNAVFVAGRPVALIDFDTAAPGPRLWDLGYSAFTWLDLGNDEVPAGEQVRRLAVFAAGYGDGATPAQIAVHALARQAALAASARARGLDAVADWAAAAATWTALYLVEPLVATGYPPISPSA